VHHARCAVHGQAIGGAAKEAADKTADAAKEAADEARKAAEDAKKAITPHP